MSSQREALEYHVAPDGRVDTNGFYRTVSEAEWSSLPPLKTVRQTRYKPIIAAIRQGQIVAVRAHDRKTAWERTKSLQRLGEREGVQVQTKTVADPERPGECLVLARSAGRAGT